MADQPKPTSEPSQEQKRQQKDLEGALTLVPAITELYRAFKQTMDPSDALALTQTIVTEIVRK
jgi:hypothetical protein